MDYIPHTPEEKSAMLGALGIRSEDDLFSMIPTQLRNPNIQMPPPCSEMEIVERMEEAAAENAGAACIAFLGGGAYRHFIPKAIGALISRSDFATAYTPYQPEVSQGTLQAIYEFQSLIANLTGLEVANAGMYDGATALAEAALMACRITRKEKVLVPTSVNPDYLRVLRTYASGADIEVGIIPTREGQVDLEALRAALDDSVSAVFIQHPNFYGILEPVDDIRAIVQAFPAILGAVSYPISLGLLKSPGAWGAEIAVGDLQPLGIPLSFGGPYSGYIAARQKHVRQLPGRLVGRTQDIQGKNGFVLTLQTREQHIRRAKATSNICTNQALCALAAAIYLSLMGPAGLRRVAKLSVRNAHRLYERLRKIEGVRLAYDRPYFNEFMLETPLPAADFVQTAKSHGLLPGIVVPVDDRHPKGGLLVCATEMTRESDIERYARVLQNALKS